MTTDAKSSFVYVTYIKTSPERIWEALITPEFVAQYWLGTRPEAEWKVGGAWKLVSRDGSITDTGEIAEFDPPRRLAIRWLNEWKPELKAEGWSLCTMEIEPVGDAVKLTVTHSIERADSKLVVAVSGGWPQILSNLKSLLETGAVVIPAKV
jgi:uncharacterized protein YndB with AHSA1/START domain